MKYGLIGAKLGHSHSPAIHKALGNPDYILKEIPESDIERFMTEKDFMGINVTIPYKKTVTPYLDEISKEALEIGSVNTVVNKSGKLYGYNTDIYGMKLALKRIGVSLKDKKVLVLGSGGTSLTARALAKFEGASQVITVSRSGNVNYENVYEIKDAEVIINTTPVGMYPNNGKAALDISRFKKLKGVFDAVYNPIRTKLVSDAIACGIPASGGLYMLVAQAKRAAELFFDKEIEDTETDRVYKLIEDSVRNIILIGMPGCGKSVIGSKLAEKLGCEFIDMDKRIEENAGMPIPEIFGKYGEEVFRKYETDAAYELGMLSGKVIATGGGIVKLERNYLPLHQNGVIIRIKRDIDKLPKDGRPISMASDLKKLAEEREPLYRAFADFTVENTGTLREAVESILKKLTEAR